MGSCKTRNRNGKRNEMKDAVLDNIESGNKLQTLALDKL